jgi:hypothetical protein
MFGDPHGRERVKHQKHSAVSIIELTLDKEIVSEEQENKLPQGQWTTSHCILAATTRPL